DRLLKKVRMRYPGKGLSLTRHGPAVLKHHIPIRTDNCIHLPGFLEADTVAHCGNSLAGGFVWSLTFTDIFSQWTENRAVWNNWAAEVLLQVQEMERALPFVLLGFDVDIRDGRGELLGREILDGVLSGMEKMPGATNEPWLRVQYIHGVSALLL